MKEKEYEYFKQWLNFSMLYESAWPCDLIDEIHGGKWDMNLQQIINACDFRLIQLDSGCGYDDGANANERH